MAPYVKISGVWKKINKMHVNIGGTWKQVNNSYVRIGGVWKKFFTGVTPGSITYTALGSYNFTVPFYNSLVVELWGSGGGGRGYTNGAAGTASKWDGGSSSGKPEAGGGAGGTNATGAISGGVAVNGDINSNGGSANTGTYGVAANGGIGDGGAGFYEAGVTGFQSQQSGKGGGGGAYCYKAYQSGVYTEGQVVSIVVGDGGNAGGIRDLYEIQATAGENGQVKITWS